MAAFLSVSVQAERLTALDLREIANMHVLEATSHFKAQGLRSEFNIGNITPQLTVPKCISEPQAKLRRNILQTQHNTLEISCTAPKWQVFIPTQIKLFGQILNAKTSIPKNTRIDSYHLSKQSAQLNLTRYGTYTEFEQVEGMITRRSIRQGEAIKPSQLKAPTVIERGDQVIISASNPVISIQMKGEALSSGTKGQQISVRNTTSNRVVKAEVTGKGRVAVVL